MKKILVVDDSEVIRNIVINALDSIDLELLQAESGESAWDILQKDSSIDLVLLDWFMEGMSGYDLFMKMKESEKLGQIPVIMLTTADDKERMLQATRSGIRHYLTKPFTPEDLIIRVMQVLKMD